MHTSTAKAVYVTPSHQFPTGRIMSITRRLRLVEWAYEQESFIIEDDYSCHLRYDIKPIPSLQGLAPDKVIYVGSFSKILSPSLRVAYMVLPKNLALHLLLQIKRPISTQDLIERATKSGVYIPTKDKLWIDSEHGPYPNILLGFGGIALEDIPPAISLLRKVWLDHE